MSNIISIKDGEWPEGGGASLRALGVFRGSSSLVGTNRGTPGAQRIGKLSQDIHHY